MTKYFFYLSCLILTLGSACVFEEFDEPPIRDLARLEGNINIAELKALHVLGTPGDPIPAGSILEAVVVANDEGGNIFKELYIQDETGGVLMRLDLVGLSGSFPVGTPVAVRLDGLFVTDFAGKYQLAANAEGDRVPEALVLSTVLVNAEPVEVTPTLLTIDQLNDETTFQRYISTLVEFEGLQFVASDAGVPYADVVNNLSLNRTLRDCFGNELVTRNSSFAEFAAELTPNGNGNLVGILSAFNDTRQVTIRLPRDLDFSGTRCGISVGGDLISIADVRSQFSGSTTTVSDNSKIRGVVISDRTTNNINSQNLFLQDGASGILVRFDDGHNFNLGEELEISVSNQELSEFNGLLQINNVPLDNAVSQGPGTLPDPLLVDIADINADPETYESTLIRIEGATLSGSGTLGGGLTVSDGNASIPMFTFNSATFANNPTPSGEIEMVAIVSDFNGVQLTIRSAGDLEGGTMGGDPEQIDIIELRNLFAGGATSVPSNRFIRGVVVSDTDNENTTGRNMVIQDASGGITVRFSDNHNFALNEDVRVDVGGMELSDFNGLEQVNNVPNANAASFGPVDPPTPRVATVQEILDNGEEWESTVVLIENVTVSGGSTWEGGLTITDATGSISTFTRSQATFAGTAIPGGTVNLTCVVSQFNDRQVFIRNTGDIN